MVLRRHPSAGDDAATSSPHQNCNYFLGPPGGVWGPEKRRGGGARGGGGAGAPATPMALLLLARGGRRGAMVDRILRADLCSFVSFPPKRRKIVWNFDLSDVHVGPLYCSRRNGSRQINQTHNLPRFFPPAS